MKDFLGAGRLPALEWWALGICVWLGTSLAGLSNDMIISICPHIQKDVMRHTTASTTRSAATGPGTGAAETEKAATK